MPFNQEVSDVYNSPFLHTDELKMALPPENFPGPSRNGPPARNIVLCLWKRCLSLPRRTKGNQSIVSWDRLIG